MNRPAYYFTEGLIWLMLVGSPFAVIGVYQSLTGRLQVSPTTTPPNPAIPRTLAMVALALPATLSLISHKEVRFIYPIFPILIILLSGPVASFYHPFPSPPSRFRRILLFGTLIFNFIAIIFFGYIHQRGVKSVMGFLRSEFENHNPELVTLGRTDSITRMSVGVLMPCHSIPWRSHLVYPEIDAWALTCEPPLGMSEEAKKSYLDEADVFYEDPSTWITQNVGAGKPREWPEYLLLFGQLEKGLKTSVPGGMYEECWRGFNSFWHDDPRRKGDVIVWCRKQSVVR
jgi:phosphatidylinositol glycan class B